MVAFIRFLPSVHSSVFCQSSFLWKTFETIAALIHQMPLQSYFHLKTSFTFTALVLIWFIQNLFSCKKIFTKILCVCFLKCSCSKTFGTMAALIWFLSSVHLFVSSPII